MIRSQINAGAIWFTSYSKNNFNRHLKFVLTKMGWKDASRFTSNAFRRGSTQELFSHWSTISVIKSAGAWLGAGYGSYIDLEFDKAHKIPKILTTCLSDGSSSDGERNTPSWKRGECRERVKVLRHRTGRMDPLHPPTPQVQPQILTRMPAGVNGGCSSHS